MLAVLKNVTLARELLEKEQRKAKLKECSLKKHVATILINYPEANNNV